MSTITQLQQDLTDALSMKSVSGAYAEAATSKLKRIRGEIETNISFASELAELFAMVKSQAKKQLVKTKTKKQSCLNILLTSSHKFYGRVEHPLMRYYMESINKLITTLPNYTIEKMVVGGTGDKFLSHYFAKKDYQSMVFNNDIPNAQELLTLSKIVQSYEIVYIYHVHFKNLLVQIPIASDINQSMVFTKNVTPKDMNHIVEPEISKMLVFFETQITQLLVNRTFLESELARTANRMIAMDEAQSNADEYIKQSRLALQSAQKSAENITLLDAIIGFISWKKQQAKNKEV